MRKIAFILFTALLLSFSTNAQSLLGTWGTIIDETIFTIAFDENGDMAMSSGQSLSEEGMEILLLITMPGTYKHNGNVITMLLDANEVELEASSPSLSDEQNKEFTTLILANGGEDLKKRLAAEFPESGDFTIKSLDDNNLVLDFNGTELAFTKDP